MKNTIKYILKAETFTQVVDRIVDCRAELREMVPSGVLEARLIKEILGE